MSGRYRDNKVLNKIFEKDNAWIFAMDIGIKYNLTGDDAYDFLIEICNFYLNTAIDWKDISTAPHTNGSGFFVFGGKFNSAYSQIHGMSNDRDYIEVFYEKQANPDVDPPYRLSDDFKIGIKNPTHWLPLPTSPNKEFKNINSIIKEKDNGYELASIGGKYEVFGDDPSCFLEDIIEYYFKE